MGREPGVMTNREAAAADECDTERGSSVDVE
jgi:hypothetical protein